MNLTEKQLADLKTHVVIFKDSPTESNFREIYKILDYTIYKYIHNIIKDSDIACGLHSDTFTKIYFTINQCESIDNFLMWVYTISRNIIYQYRKYTKYDREITISDLKDSGYDQNNENFSSTLDVSEVITYLDMMSNENIPSNIPSLSIYERDPDQEYMNQMRYQIMLECIDELPDKSRQLMIDKYILGIKEKDLNEYYNIKLPALKYRTRRALSDLTVIYKKRERELFRKNNMGI